MREGRTTRSGRKSRWERLLDENCDAGLDAAARQRAQVVARIRVRRELHELDEVPPQVSVVGARDVSGEAAEQWVRVVVRIPARPGARRVAEAALRLPGAVAR